jgi:hypothetical protein
MNRLWTDKVLFERYEITSKQVAFIESLIAERPSDEEIDSVEEDDE